MEGSVPCSSKRCTRGMVKIKAGRLGWISDAVRNASSFWILPSFFWFEFEVSAVSQSLAAEALVTQLLVVLHYRGHMHASALVH
jgi:hypothetical protein